MTLRRTLRVLFAAALVAALQGALVHPLGHLNSSGGFVHLGGGHSPAGSGDKNGASPLCDAIAAVAACVGSSANSPLVALAGVEPLVVRHPAAPRSAESPAYRSQAPPLLL